MTCIADVRNNVRLIPAIDLKAGHCVRLLHGDFAAETRYGTDPEALLEKYRDMGADWLHVVDLDGAKEGSLGNRESIERLAAHKTVKLQVGGGLRNTAAVSRMLDLGAARVVIGSAAVTQVENARTWLEHFGPDRVTLAFDVRLDDDGTPRVQTHGWQRQSELSLWSAVANFTGSQLKHVLCTDVGRDGALTGPNVALYREAANSFPSRTCSHSCQTHNPLPGCSRRTGGQGRAFSRPSRGRRHSGSGGALSR